MSRIAEMKQLLNNKRITLKDAQTKLHEMIMDAMELTSNYSYCAIAEAIYSDATHDGVTALDIYDAVSLLAKKDIFLACEIGEENVNDYVNIVDALKTISIAEAQMTMDLAAAQIQDAAAKVRAENRKR